MIFAIRAHAKVLSSRDYMFFQFCTSSVGLLCHAICAIFAFISDGPMVRSCLASTYNYIEATQQLSEVHRRDLSTLHVLT